MNWKELESEKTEDLITYINWKNDPALIETAEAAFHAFCFRFQQDIAHKCRTICINRGYDQDLGDDLAQRTFERFWKYPNYDHRKSNVEDYDTGVKLFLYRYATNLLNDFYRASNNSNPNPYNGDEELIYDYPNIENISGSAEKLKVIKEQFEHVKKALDRLGPKHKIIYLTYKQHEQEGFKLPRHLTEKLRKELQLTQATIQSYKKEAFDKIKEYIDIYGSK
jgi:RNA polymerase sigma factor (sigma-70 family)